MVAMLLTGTIGNADPLESLGSMALIGAGLFGVGALRLPGWAKLRRRQMEQLSQQLTQLP
jgi:hypothetical protein